MCSVPTPYSTWPEGFWITPLSPRCTKAVFLEVELRYNGVLGSSAEVIFEGEAPLDAVREVFGPLCAHFGPFPPARASDAPEVGTLTGMIRVLVTLVPRMYRQAVALSIQRNRPGIVDVRLAPPEEAEAELASFRPHLLVHNDSTSSGLVAIPEAALKAVPHRLEVLYSDSMDVRLSADGRLTELRDASTEDLLGAVDAASLAAREESPG